jgi:hypothetical protein
VEGRFLRHLRRTLVYAAFTLRLITIQSIEVSGTMVNDRSDVKPGALVDYLTVQLDSGDTVRASSAGKIDYRPGQRVLVKEKSTNFFGIREHEFKKYLDERRRSDENRKFSSADIGTHVCH